jgi:lipopolysaccharide transport system permease protein
MALVVFEATSRLAPPGAFVRAAIHDLGRALPLARRLFARELATRYRHSTLGVFWASMPAAATFVLLTMGVRAGLSGTASSGLAVPLQGAFGMIFVQTFLEALAGQRTLFAAFRHELAQQTPLEAIVLARFAECTFGTAMRLAVVVLAMLAFGVRVEAVALALPCFLVAQLLGAALGLVLAPWSALSRDAEHLMWALPIVVLVTTPVFVPLAQAGVRRWVQLANPLTHLLEAARFAAWGGVRFGFGGSVLALAASVLLLALGWAGCRLSLPYVREHAMSA